MLILREHRLIWQVSGRGVSGREGQVKEDGEIRTMASSIIRNGHEPSVRARSDVGCV
jgi:hypothetical protein